MKQHNAPLSLRSAILIMTCSILLELMSAAIAKACSPAYALGCDINCTIQIANDCSDPTHLHCVFRTCEYTDCSRCPGGHCGDLCDGLRYKACGACIGINAGCSELYECCQPE